MAQGKTGKINYRCPQCLFRTIDYDLLYDRMQTNTIAAAAIGRVTRWRFSRFTAFTSSNIRYA